MSGRIDLGYLSRFLFYFYGKVKPLHFSIVIPVFNRPEELKELLQSISVQKSSNRFEVLVVEDGSVKKSQDVVSQYKNNIDIKYLYKQNSGPGDSRNYGMQRAAGTYFLLLDSDCVLPPNYLEIVEKGLQENYADAFGGPDAAHDSFSVKQKAINYAMTSFWSTGGLRGKETSKEKFQLRSFNMGLSRKAFDLTGGFSMQRIGEDIDLNFRLWEQGCTTRFMKEAYVYHKRRTSWRQFFRQTKNFGAARPVLNRLHKGTSKLTYWFPSFFLVGLILSLALVLLEFPYLLWVYLLYLMIILYDATVKTGSLWIGLSSVYAVLVQFLGYGSGFLRSVFRIYLQRRTNMEAFPAMFA